MAVCIREDGKMINGNIDGTGVPACMDDYLMKAMEIMKGLNAESPSGKVIVDGDNFYYTVMETEVKPVEEIKFEMHKKYIDIHYVIEGNERIAVANGNMLKVSQPYSEEKDCVLCYDGQVMSIIALQEKDFCVIYPYEAHKPGGMVNDFCKIKKAVFKIKV
jgi:YhcH/YjgK/YiaL family protein